MTRGLLVELTPDQIVNRLLYLAGELPISALDPHIRRGEAPTLCPTIYYRLEDHNGGTDPTAADPATRWPHVNGTGTNVTCDCSGAQAWAHGYDRYQPLRAPHIGGGWINTNGMIADARGAQKCFKPLAAPTRGCIVVCGAGSRGHAVGHTGGVVGYKLSEWDPTQRKCWDAIEVIDVAGRVGRANARTTGHGWYDTHAMFLLPIMKP